MYSAAARSRQSSRVGPLDPRDMASAPDYESGIDQGFLGDSYYRQGLPSLRPASEGPPRPRHHGYYPRISQSQTWHHPKLRNKKRDHHSGRGATTRDYESINNYNNTTTTGSSSRGRLVASAPAPSSRHQRNLSVSEAILAKARKVLSRSSEGEQVRVLTKVINFAKAALGQLDPTSSSSSRGGLVVADPPFPASNNAIDSPHYVNLYPRSFLNWYIRHKDNGTWQASVSLYQPGLVRDWNSPQGTRPDVITLGFYPTEQAAITACENSVPPLWMPLDNSSQCSGCLTSFKGVQASAHHCRNCGHLVCSKCSKNRWSSFMVPPTYHFNERTVRVCDSCYRLAVAFHRALHHANIELACHLYSTGNINIRTPFVGVVGDNKIKEYPVHAAAEGGSLELLQWLIEDLGCPLYQDNGSPLSNHQGDSVLGVAARRGDCQMMRWLVNTKACSLRELGGKDLWSKALGSFVKEDLPLRGRIRAPEPSTTRAATTTPTPTTSTFSMPKLIPRGKRVMMGAINNPLRPRKEEKKVVPTNNKAVDGAGHCIEECIVCMERAVDSVLIPCGHICCCKTCVSQFVDCPVCRVPIERVVRTYHVC